MTEKETGNYQKEPQMTAAPHESQTTSSAIFQWHSLKTRVTLSTLAIFLVSIWSLSFYASQMLREDMQRIMGEQQFSTASIIAADINGETGDRLRALEKVAARITPAILGNAVSMQTFLEDSPAIESMFSGGLWITRLDGTTIASVPVSIGRIGMNYIERDYLVGALKGKLTIGKPAIGKKLGVPSVIVASPIRDTEGKVIGALIGGINLGVPNFLDKIADNRYGKRGDYLLVAPQYRLIITASDKSRIMEVLPAPGVNLLIDRFIQGYEGSGITINPRGEEVLASAKGIPVSGWYVAALLPTEEAFAPIRAMIWRMLLATIFLSLLAGILTWGILKRQLAPVFTTIKTLATLADTDRPPEPLPITRQDEIGALIGGFNRLLLTLGQRDEALRESEKRFNLSMEATKDGLWDWNIRTDETYFSPGYYRMLGYEADAFPGEGNAWKDLVHPDDREHALRANMDCIEGRREHFESEFRMKTKNGEWRWILGRGKCVERDEQGRALRLVGTHVDITERKLAEEALNTNKVQLSTALEMAHLGHWEYDVKTDLFTFNDHFYKIFRTTVEQVGGYTMHSAEYARRFVHPDDSDMVGEETQKAIETTDPHFNRQVEHRMLYADGKVGYLTVRFLIVKDSHGRTVKTYGVNQDITERKQAEEALRESEERYRTILQTTMDGFWLADMQGHLLEVNESYCRMSGYSKEELLTMSASDLEAAETDAETAAHMQKVMTLGEDRFETWHHRKNGSVFEVEISVQYKPSKGGKLVAFLRDITARKQAEQALKTSEGTLSDIVEFLPDATFVIDLDGKVIAWNRAIEEMTGIRKEEMLGQGDHAYAIPFYGERRRQLLDLIDVSDKELESKYKSVQRKGNTFYAEAFTPALYGGKGAHVWTTGASLFDGSGNRVGAIESIRDVTGHKKAEEERQCLEERLQRSEKMEALGLLAGGVAHDLNNVLGVVVGYAELVLMKADESSPIRPQLLNIMNGGLKAAAIVDDLLTLARRGVSDRDVLSLNKIIADCKKSPEFESLSFHHPSVKIEADIDPDLPNISGSSVHLGKSLYNLISNASEAMPKGGVVTIKTTNQYMDKPIQGYDNIQEGDYVVLSVSDTGEGISADNLKRIFEPFYTKKVMGRSGTGLGLSVVWGTVKDHHGYINVQSEEGKGSTFTLYFPVTREGITAEAVAVDISAYMGSGESILVVDDVKEQRDLAAGMLRSLNYNVTSVSSGEYAIEHLKEHKIDLMVLDMIMDPGMDGLDTYKQVLGIHPQQKAIIVSGFSESERVRAAKGLGAGAYVRKPYIKEKLGVAVRKELDRSA